MLFINECCALLNVVHYSMLFIIELLFIIQFNVVHYWMLFNVGCFNNVVQSCWNRRKRYWQKQACSLLLSLLFNLVNKLQQFIHGSTMLYEHCFNDWTCSPGGRQITLFTGCSTTLFTGCRIQHCSRLLTTCNVETNL